MKNEKNIKTAILVLLAAIVVMLLLTMQQPFPDHLTKIDFRAYWGASYLLSQSENFSDAQELLLVQRRYTGWEQASAQKTWNPPWLLAWLLPFTLFDFERASWFWFLTNIILIFTSVALLWNLYATRSKSHKKIWVGFLIAFTFLPTLTTLLIGQITALILFGLTLFLFLEQRKRFFSSGIALSLVTVKPHLVYITLPLIFLILFRKRRWRVIAGFFTLILSGTIIALWLRPSFPFEYFDTVTGGKLLQLTVPTLGFFLFQQTGWEPIKLMGIVVLPLAIVWQYRQREQLSMADLVCATLPLSIVTSPFGWSFDVIILLIPMLRLAMWGVEGRLSKRHTSQMLFIFIVANGIVLYQRTGDLWDYELFWFPIVLAGLYYWGWNKVDKA